MSTLFVEEFFCIILFVILIILANHTRKCIKARAEEKKTVLFKAELDVAESIIETVVVALNASKVKYLKLKNSDNKLTPEEAKEVLEEAVDTVKKTLGPQLLDAIKENIGDENLWIVSEIEKFVALNKEK